MATNTATDDWVPSPRHLLRVACIEDVTKDWAPGSVLEVGAGTGDVTSRFVARGFNITANDMGETSRRLLRERFGDTIKVVDSLDEVPMGTADFLFAFEVLEHIDDDLAALTSWAQHVRPGGQLLISVPAHQRKFSDADRAVGHVRRYERTELTDLITNAGFESVEIANYGFPLGNVLRHAQTGARVVARRRSDEAGDEHDRLERTMDSGVRTAGPLNKMRSILRPGVFAPFAAVQRRAFGRDWSDGYVATARRSS